MAAVGSERQRIDADHGGQIELAIKMRKQRAAARRLPFQPRAEAGGIDVQQHEIALAGEMLGRGFGRLLGGGEMDEAVLHVDRRATEDAVALGFAPQRRGQIL